jgi:hypothetical protein
MYPKNAASPQRIAIGAVVQISDGAVQTSGVLVKVMPQGGAAAGSAGTVAYEEGIVHYVPTQAETNYASFMVIAYKTGCIPVAATIVTTASGVAGYAGLDWATINAPTTTQGLSGTTVKTATDVETDTADIQSRLPAALVFGRVDASVGAMAANVMTAAAAASDLTTELQSGLATASALSTVAGYLDTEIAAILADTNELQTDWANGGRLDLILDARASQTSVDIIDDFLDTEVAAIKAKTDSLTFTDAGKVDANVLSIGTDTTALAAFKAAVRTNVTGTVGAASSTTSVVTSSMSPAADVTDQFKGLIIKFDLNTSTAALRGQASDITASTSAGVLTVTALTNAPANGDTFVIL